MIEDFYNTTDAAKKIGCSKRQLQWWDETNALRPMRYEGRRVYSDSDIQRGRVAVTLASKGLPVRSITRWLRGTEFAKFNVFQKGQTPCTFDDADQVIAWAKENKGGPFHLVEL